MVTKHRYMKQILIVIVTFSLFMNMSIHIEAVENDFSIHTIFVGNGDAILVQCGNQNLLIDAGYSTVEEQMGIGKQNPLSSYLEKSNSLAHIDNQQLLDFRATVKTLVNQNPDNTVTKYLESKNIKSVDYMIATHPHYDHIGGFISVINRFTSANSKIWWSQPSPKDPYYEAFQGILADRLMSLEEEQGVIDPFFNVMNPNVGDYFMLGDGEKKARVLFLAVAKDENTSSITSINNNAVIVRVDYGNTSYLFASDLQRMGQQRLIKESHDVLAQLQERARAGDPNLQDMLQIDNILDVDVLKLPHHGFLNLDGQEDQTHSGNYALFETVHPKISLVSTTGYSGMENYFLPAMRVQQDLSYSDIYSTGVSGDIVLTSDGTQINVAAQPLKKLHRLKQPTNLNVKANQNDIQITWDPIEYAEGYRVYYKESLDDDWHYLSQQKNSDYTFKNGEPGKSYWFVVRGYISANPSYVFSPYAQSNEIKFPKTSYEFSGFHEARVFYSPNAKNYGRLNPYTNTWMSGNMSKYNNKALLLTRQALRSDGTLYYSAYYNGAWVGYVNSYALKNRVTSDTYNGWETTRKTFDTPNPGKYYRLDPYKNVWMGNMSQYRGKELVIKRQLTRPDGNVYYSCYYNGKWIGYVNSWGFS